MMKAILLAASFATRAWADPTPLLSDCPGRDETTGLAVRVDLRVTLPQGPASGRIVWLKDQAVTRELLATGDASTRDWNDHWQASLSGAGETFDLSYDRGNDQGLVVGGYGWRISFSCGL